MTNSFNCATIIPIYKNEFTNSELFSVSTSLQNLQETEIFWIAPEGLNTSFYKSIFGDINTIHFRPEYFENISGYNNLLTSKFFYEIFIPFEFVLICQPDAIVIKPEISKWLQLPYDYIGAPWYNGYSLKLNLDLNPDANETIIANAFVGNGGLSLRRVAKAIKLIDEFLELSKMWGKMGHAEDIFFGLTGGISKDFILPNIRVASEFCQETELKKILTINNNTIPFGVHAWEKYNKEYWLDIFSSLNLPLNDFNLNLDI